MDFELWWLFGFALFFGLGWLAARIDIKQLLSESRQLPRSYFKGLNFLLNEQPDKAIEAFIEVVKVDPQTVELHFALGSLFRRRGETERAIRMHRNLLERPDLGAEQRLHAMVELGQDYLKAGLLDRAEEMFLKLQGSPHRAEALKFLLEIYQQEKDWMKAVGIALELEKDSGQSSQKEIANYYCELALSEVTHSRPDGARHRPEAAHKLVKDELRSNQTLLGLDKLLEAQLLVAPAERRHDLELVRNLIHSHTQRLARYHCENCGFKARHFYWHCPACGGWETYPPRRNEEFELTP